MPETPTPTSQPPTEQVLLQWEAPIHATHKRTVRWYATAGACVLIAAVYGVVSGAWSVAMVAVLIGAVYFLLRNHTFPASRMSITDRGVRIDERMLPWAEAQGFWLLVTPGYTELHVVPTNNRVGEMIIQTGATDLQTIKQVISAYIPELTDKRESFLDAFIRLCKL